MRRRNMLFCRGVELKGTKGSKRKAVSGLYTAPGAGAGAASSPSQLDQVANVG